MSVAFRREGDDEHLEPKFERPIPPGANLVTARGLSLIEAKVAEIEAAIADADEEAATTLKRDLRYWHTRRATAQVTVAEDDGLVAFGTRVVVRGRAGERALTIVGGDEAAPAEGLIGFQAPLARALLDAAEGDRVAFNGDMLEIVSITPIGTRKD